LFFVIAAIGTPLVAHEANDEVPVSQHVDFKALQDENKQLKELIGQLSKLVVKYVVEQH